jgi:hypothetical protein
MKIIRIIILSVLSFSIALSQTPLDNKLRIRIADIETDDSLVNDKLTEFGLKVERRMLPIEASYLLGNKPVYKSSNNSKINKIIEAEKPLLRTYIVSFEGNVNPEKLALKLQQENKFIEIAEPIYPSKVQGFTPNDPYIQNQEDALELIKAFDAWEISTGSEDITIAISDNGIQQTHEDLRNNIAYNTDEIPNNGIDDDENGYIDDYNGYNFDANEQNQKWSNTYTNNDHGTLVAGIAGADFNNDLGVAGVGGESRIFPIRIGSDEINARFTLYDYESIIYAAISGFDVINCSWGLPKTYSDIEQSVIDYAVTNDVVVVAAAGNETDLEKYYPAGYDGVLGVGAVTAFDSEAGGPKGSHLDIFAPSSQNYTTDLDQGQNTPYESITTATSFSAPVVSGAAAILRAHRPKLSALEVIEFLRQSVDDISEDRPFYKQITTGRLNMLKMLTIEPMSIPGIRVEESRYFDATGAPAERFEIGDTAFVELTISNVLGDGNDLDFNLSVGYPEFPILEFIESEFNDINIKRYESFTTGRFKFVVVNESSEYLTMRLDISGPNDYKDFVLFDFVPNSEITTFENEKIKFSVSDVGTFGYESGSFFQNYKLGVGFINKDYGNGLYRAGVFAVEDDNNVITSLEMANDESEFYNVKPYNKPSNTSAIMSNDPFRNTRVEIRQTIELPRNLPWVRIKVDVTDSAAFGGQYSIGYEFDWDIGLNPAYKNNTTSFLPSARPSNIDEEKFASISTSGFGDLPSFGVAMYSDEEDALAQAAGYSAGNSVSNSILTSTMQSGKSIITDEVADVYNIIGMRFNTPFDDYETKTCYLCVSSGDDNSDLASNLQECASGITSVNLDKYDDSITYIDNIFEVNSANYIKAYIIDLSGRVMSTNSSNRISLSGLNQGVYLVSFEFDEGFIIKKVAILN